MNNYIKIAARNLIKRKGFSSINILGLALGLGTSILILLWVLDERGVDAFHEKGDRLYLVYKTTYYGNKVTGSPGTSPLLPAEITRIIPEIEAASGLSWSDIHTFTSGDKIIKEKGNEASPDFFSLFSYGLLAGNARDALNTPESMAISRKMALAFFGNPGAAIGKTLRYDNRKDFTVKAVFDDVPLRSTEQFDYVLSWNTFMEENSGWAYDWGNSGPRTYVLLRPDADPALVKKKIARFLDGYDKDQGKGLRAMLGLQLYSDTYLHGNFENGQPAGGRIAYVLLFSLVAIFILLIACINFMNLTTAHSMRRAKEIGVRKVMGAVRGALIRQFIGEAILVALLSAIVALLLAALALPAFNQLTGKHIALPYFPGRFWLFVAGLVVLTGIISGSYPALFLSGFNPVRVLKGSVQRSGGGVWFRKSLVVFQFVLSIVLIISTILISRQVNYIQNANLGYDRENLIYIPLNGNLQKKLEVFRQEALRLPGVGMITEISTSPTSIVNGTGGVVWTGKDPNSKEQFTQAAVGYDFIPTMKLQLAGGRDYSRELASDSVGYIINETALSRMGYKNPIGKPLEFWGKKGTIIGVLKDFHFQSLHDPINPLVLRLGQAEGFAWALVRTQPGKTKQALSGLEQLCRQLNPQFLFSYRFSDEEYGKLYRTEQIAGRLSVLFALLAIFISCLGLLGLSIFTAGQKTREISIRKVLGASAVSLFGLLSLDFLVLVGIAFVIASPIAWWAMHQWLQGFAFRTTISWWIFGVSGVLALLIALATICFQAIKTACVNPVKSLRAE